MILENGGRAQRALSLTFYSDDTGLNPRWSLIIEKEPGSVNLGSTT